MNQENKNESKLIRQRIIDEYIRLTPKSQKFFERSEKALVAGVTGNLRFFKPYPLYFAGGQGSLIIDIDDNEYIDCFLCNGPLQLGHRPKKILEAIQQHDSTGALVVNPMLATEVAERLIEIIPSAERVRFVSSGTEAVMTAIRCARGDHLTGARCTAVSETHTPVEKAIEIQTDCVHFSAPNRAYKQTQHWISYPSHS